MSLIEIERRVERKMQHCIVAFEVLVQSQPKAV